MTPVTERPAAAPDRAEVHPLLLDLYTETNAAMPALCATLGFQRVPPHAGSGSVAALPQLAAFMVSSRMAL